MLGSQPVRGGLLAKGPDTSLGEVHRGSCSEGRSQGSGRRSGRLERDARESKVRVEERTDNHSGA